MYLPSHFEESRPEVLHQLVREHALGTLVTLGADGLNANHIPFELDAEVGPHGVLRAHVARGNPVWRDCSNEVESLVVFQGAQTYISPSLYATKQEGGRVVPTWNYMVVHAYGPLRVIDDPVWLRAQLERLTGRHEGRRAQPWKLEDAPADYIERRLSAIVGIEIPVTRLVGKWKVSQNQQEVNRVSIEAGLRAEGGENALAMADAVANLRKQG
jgi:transcriptional regulator